MKPIQVLLLALAVSGVAFAGDVLAAPEVGVDGATIASAVGVVGGALLIMRARRKK